uniref:DUF5615 domain-containing protein n=1 Tax=Solibacter usitatus (strain Ellin6076) TaxID=234267 RepID=Q01T95_SOLUE
MRFKLDENLGSRSTHLFRQAGHSVETVLEEGLSGAADEAVFNACLLEDRCLVTLDLDFADVMRFPPHKAAGIAVLRLPKGASLRVLEKFVSDRLSTLVTESIEGRLWVVEAGRIRVHEKTSLEADGAK